LKIKFSRLNTRAKETRVKMFDGFETDNRGHRLNELFMAQNLDICPTHVTTLPALPTTLVVQAEQSILCVCQYMSENNF